VHENVWFEKTVSSKIMQSFNSEKIPKIYFTVLTTGTHRNNKIFPLR